MAGYEKLHHLPGDLKGHMCARERTEEIVLPHSLLADHEGVCEQEGKAKAELYHRSTEGAEGESGETCRYLRSSLSKSQ